METSGISFKSRAFIRGNYTQIADFHDAIKPNGLNDKNCVRKVIAKLGEGDYLFLYTTDDDAKKLENFYTSNDKNHFQLIQVEGFDKTLKQIINIVKSQYSKTIGIFFKPPIEIFEAEKATEAINDGKFNFAKLEIEKTEPHENIENQIKLISNNPIKTKTSTTKEKTHLSLVRGYKGVV